MLLCKSSLPTACVMWNSNAGQASKPPRARTDLGNAAQRAKQAQLQADSELLVSADTVGCSLLSFELACPTSQKLSPTPTVLLDAHAFPSFSSAFPHPDFGKVFTHPLGSQLPLDAQPASMHHWLPFLTQHPRHLTHPAWVEAGDPDHAYSQYTERLLPLGVPTDHSHAVVASTRAAGACCSGIFKFTLTPPSSSTFNIRPLVRPAQTLAAEAPVDSTLIYSILDAHPPFLHFEHVYTAPAGYELMTGPAAIYSTAGLGAPASMSALQQQHWPFAVYPVGFPGSVPILVSPLNSSPAGLQVASASAPAPADLHCDKDSAEARDSEDDGLSDSGSFADLPAREVASRSGLLLLTKAAVVRISSGARTGKRSRQLCQLHFVCTFAPCTAAFNNRSSFQYHLTTHSQARFPCLFYGCSSVLAFQSALSVHMRIHMGASPYYCNNTSCGLSFSTKAKLDRHKLKHKPADAQAHGTSQCSGTGYSGPVQ